MNPMYQNRDVLGGPGVEVDDREAEVRAAEARDEEVRDGDVDGDVSDEATARGEDVDADGYNDNADVDRAAVADGDPAYDGSVGADSVHEDSVSDGSVSDDSAYVEEAEPDRLDEAVVTEPRIGDEDPGGEEVDARNDQLDADLSEEERLDGEQPAFAAIDSEPLNESESAAESDPTAAEYATDEDSERVDDEYDAEGGDVRSDEDALMAHDGVVEDDTVAEEPPVTVTDEGDLDSDVDSTPYETAVGVVPVPMPVAVDEMVVPEPAAEDSTSVFPQDAEGSAEDGTWVDGAAAVAGGMHPGDAEIAEASVVGVDADAFRDRLQQAQMSFIDDPRGATEAARTLAAEAIEAHIAALRQRTGQLDGWASEDRPDTEVLRAAMRAYRDLINALAAE